MVLTRWHIHVLKSTLGLLLLSPGPAMAQADSTASDTSAGGAMFQRKNMWDVDPLPTELQVGVVVQEGAVIKFEYTIPYSGYVQLSLHKPDSTQFAHTAMIKNEGKHYALFKFNKSPYSQYYYVFTYKSKAYWNSFAVESNSKLQVGLPSDDPANQTASTQNDESTYSEESSGESPDDWMDDFEGEFDFDEDASYDESGESVEEDLEDFDSWLENY
jgi:hypothetical protein